MHISIVSVALLVYRRLRFSLGTLLQISCLIVVVLSTLIDLFHTKNMALNVLHNPVQFILKFTECV